MSIFHIPENAPPSPITVTAPRAIAGPTLTVSGWPSTWTVFPKILVVRRANVASPITILETTGINGANLAISGAIDGAADAAQVAGDTVEIDPTALSLLELQTAYNSVVAALSLKAPLDSPPLIGIPTVPTATPGTNTQQAASTAFVLANAGGGGSGNIDGGTPSSTYGSTSPINGGTP